MVPGFGPPPNEDMQNKLRAKKPKNLKDLPRFVKETVGGLFSRIGYIFKLVWEAKPSLLFWMLFMTVFNGVMPLVGTLITANLLAKVVLSFTQPVNLIEPLIWQFGYIFLNSLFSSLNSSIMKIAGERVTNHVKIKIMNKAKDVDMASFDMPDFYERLENANREAGIRPINIMNATFELISKIISLVSYLVVLSGLLVQLPTGSYYLFAAFVVLCIVSAAVSFYFRRKNFLYLRRRSLDRRQMNYYSDLLVNKDMVKEIRLFDLADVFVGRYKTVFTKYFRGVRNLVVKEGVSNVLLALGMAVLNGWLFWLVATNVTQIDSYTIYTGALNSISASVSALIGLTAGIYEGSLFIDNMILFMNEEKTVKPILPEPLVPQRGVAHTIELRHVSFSYPETERKVINDVSFTLKAGDTAVLVGLNGAGKTTLIKLITRLYDPTEGQILLDGHDIREYDLNALYAIYGIIFQDFGKYAVSVSENISFGQVKKPVEPKNVETAAEQSGADGFIERLPHRYDTQLMRYFDREGIELSIGQWQKLSTARAFYSDSDILILDEPTASLDAIAEQEVFSQFDSLRRDKTTIFVSHRLSSATIADVIIVLKEGKLVEMGNHKELMANKGDYYTLFSTQAKRYISAQDEINTGEDPGTDGPAWPGPQMRAGSFGDIRIKDIPGGRPRPVPPPPGGFRPIREDGRDKDIDQEKKDE